MHGTTHLLLSIPPGPDGDPVLAHYARRSRRLGTLDWIGYLSTIGVYGDQRGAWVDETTPLQPISERTGRGVEAERPGSRSATETGCRCTSSGSPASMGPGATRFDKLRDGTARRIVKPGQVFNRIHVEDIAGVLEPRSRGREPGAIYNVSDDEPAPPQEVVAYAAELLGMTPPPEVAFAEAELSPMARSFYAETGASRNARIKARARRRACYPTYREGLARS